MGPRATNRRGRRAKPPPSRLEALLAAVRDAPADDELRLVYADALEQSGELPRAELIRIQLALQRAPTDELRAREQAHLTAHGPRLAGAVGEHASSWRFDRGLVHEAAADAPTWIAHGAAMFANAPIRSIGIANPRTYDWDPGAMVSQLAAREWLRRVTSVKIGLHDIFGEPELIRLLLRSRHLGQLSELCLAHPSTLAAATACALPRLSGIYVYAEHATRGDQALAALASRGAKLERLQLVGCGVTADGAREIARAEWPLRHLVLGGTHYATDKLGEGGVRALAEAPALAHLEELGLFHTQLDDGALRALAASPHLRSLANLDLGSSNESVTDDGLEALASSPVLATVRTLSIAGPGVTERGLDLVRRSRFARPDLALHEVRYSRYPSPTLEIAQPGLLRWFGWCGGGAHPGYSV